MGLHDENRISVTGEIAEMPKYDYTVCGEGFLKGNIRVKRLSEQYDVLPYIISERLLQVHDLSIGEHTFVGSLRSHNVTEGERSRLMLNIFVDDICDDENETGNNNVVIEGFICKQPIYRLTPLDREITDMLVAVNRAYGKSDYIPCITWGRNARFCGKLEVGTKLKLQGRFQSREYQKKTDDGETVTKTTYELSVSKIFDVVKK